MHPYQWKSTHLHKNVADAKNVFQSTQLLDQAQVKLLRRYQQELQVI